MCINDDGRECSEGNIMGSYYLVAVPLKRDNIFCTFIIFTQTILNMTLKVIGIQRSLRNQDSRAIRGIV